MNGARRTAMLLTLVALAFGAAGTSAASAASPAWIVAGTPLKAGATEALAQTTKVTEVFTIETSKWGVECPSLKLEESLIEGENIREDKSIRLENCVAIGAPGCNVSTIALDPLTSTLEGTKEHFKLNFKPTSGTAVATVNLSSVACGSLGILTVTGTMACNYPKVESEAENHVLEFSLTSGTSLKRGTEEVTLTGKDEFWLSSKKLWWVE